jgi:hypothetical protein
MDDLRTSTPAELTAEPISDGILVPKAGRQRARVVPKPEDLPTPLEIVESQSKPDDQAQAAPPDASIAAVQTTEENKVDDDDNEPVVDLEARDSDPDEDDDVDLAKLRARQAAIAAAAAEEARQKTQQRLLMKYGVDARHPEYKGFIPHNAINALIILFAYEIRLLIYAPFSVSIATGLLALQARLSNGVLQRVFEAIRCCQVLGGTCGCSWAFAAPFTADASCVGGAIRFPVR